MSNTLYDIARQAFLTGALDWTGGDTFGVLLIDTSQYTATPSSDQYVSDVVAAGDGSAILARQDMTTPTATAGTAGADPMTIDSVTGDVGAIVVYQHSDSDADSQLIAYIDTASNLPSTYSDGIVSIMWDSSSGNGIFKI
jgi:hypothetical protein